MTLPHPLVQKGMLIQRGCLSVIVIVITVAITCRGQRADISESRLVNGCVHLYDLEHDAMESGAEAEETLPCPQSGWETEMGAGSDPNRSNITCNSTPMKRERLSGEVFCCSPDIIS